MTFSRYDIIQLPDPLLRQKSARITRFDQSLDRLIDLMISASLDWEEHRPHEVCVGLAAVQVARLQRVIILRDNDDVEAKRFRIIINPRIIKTYGHQEPDFEGCLSVPDIYGVVPRYPRVKFQALDRHGQPIRETAEGFLARLIQHETDHLRGILFIDHIRQIRNAFYNLDDEGKMEEADYEQIISSDLFR